MQVEQVNPPKMFPPDTVYPTNASGDALVAGTAVASNGTSNEVVPALATTFLGASAFGVLALDAAIGQANNPTRTSGAVTLAADQWEAVTADGEALHAGTWYYVSDVVAGKITNVAPTTPGHYLAPLGIAQSATTLLVMRSIPQEIA